MRPYAKRATPAKDRIQSKFSEILSLVQQGKTIQNACRAVNESSPNLYKSITPEQQRQLTEAKAANNGCLGRLHENTTLPAISRGKGRQSTPITKFFEEEDEYDDF